MDVSLTILFDAAGVPTCSYCGQDADAALKALAAAGETGKYEKGFVVRNPDYLKKRNFALIAAETAAGLEAAAAAEAASAPESLTDPAPAPPPAKKPK
jgi:hypothetical protein